VSVASLASADNVAGFVADVAVVSPSTELAITLLVWK